MQLYPFNWSVQINDTRILILFADAFVACKEGPEKENVNHYKTIKLHVFHQVPMVAMIPTRRTLQKRVTLGRPSTPCKKYTCDMS